MELDEQFRRVAAPRVSSSADPEGNPSISDRARADIAQAAEKAKSEARRLAGQQKEVGATTLGEVAGAVHGAAESLEAGHPQVAGYVHDAATRLEGAANTLRTRNVDDIIQDIGQFARSQPVLFFGGAMLAGFALTRFLKSTASDSQAAPGSSAPYPSSSHSSATTPGSGHPGVGSH